MDEQLKPESQTGQSVDDDGEFRKYRVSEKEFEVAKTIHTEETAAFLEVLERLHVEPTKRQKEILGAVDQGLEKLYAQYEIKKTKSSPPKIFFLNREDFKDILTDIGNKPQTKNNPDAYGFYVPERNTLVVWYKTKWAEDEGNEEFLHTVTHERIHAESLRVLAAQKEGGEAMIAPFQSGFHITRLHPEKTKNNERRKRMLFWHLNEAVTESLALSATKDIINNKERNYFENIIVEQIKNKLLSNEKILNDVQKQAQEQGFVASEMHAFPSTITEYIRITKRPLENDPKKVLALKKEYQEERERYLHSFKNFVEKTFDEDYQYEPNGDLGAYSAERLMFNRLLNALTEKNSTLGGVGNIRKQFYQAYFNGEFWKLGRIIEKTLEQGSFRLLAEDPLSSEFSKRLRLPREQS